MRILIFSLCIFLMIPLSGVYDPIARAIELSKPKKLQHYYLPHFTFCHEDKDKYDALCEKVTLERYKQTLKTFTFTDFKNFMKAALKLGIGLKTLSLCYNETNFDHSSRLYYYTTAVFSAIALTTGIKDLYESLRGKTRMAKYYRALAAQGIINRIDKCEAPKKVKKIY